jgi:4-amino-4-deoxy-L-arabinose transferase-like glycosyltransferase
LAFIDFLDQIGNRKHAGVFIGLTGTVLALVFTFLLYPLVSSSLDMTLDPDGYGRLAQGIHRQGSFSYFPNNEPSIRRGPLYPAVIGSILAIHPNAYPIGVQAVQCLLFGVTILVIFHMSETLWNRRTAVLASLICCCNPILIWFTSRIWGEVLLFLLFTLLTASIFCLIRRPSLHASLFVGVILGMLILCKQTFLPFVLLLPFLLLFMRPRIAYGHSLCIMAMTLLLVLPWTLRNWRLTGMVIPVHVAAGVQMQLGDKYVEDFTGFSSLTYNQVQEVEEEVNASIPHMPDHVSQAQKDAIGDALLLRESLAGYRDSPLLFIKKLGMNAVMFWFAASSPTKTLWITLFQLPVLAGFIIYTLDLFLKKRAVRTEHGVIVLVMWGYFGLHLPFFAVARYSSVLIPVMGMYAAGWSLTLLNKTSGSQS